MVVEEIINNRHLLAEVIPKLRTLGFIVYTVLTIDGLASHAKHVYKCDKTAEGGECA